MAKGSSGVLKEVWGCLISLLNWVNDCPTDAFNHQTVEQARVNIAAAELGSAGTCDLGEFWVPFFFKSVRLLASVCVPTNGC
jgi:hypothetical protein